MTIGNYQCVFVLFLILIGAAVILEINIFLKTYQGYFLEPAIRNFATGICSVPEWNQVTLDDVPHREDFKKWAEMGFGVSRNILRAEVRLLSAFVYTNRISIITTSQNIDNHNATCRYYDCNRNEIPSSSFDTIVAPMTVITCPRRYGAEYVSINMTVTESLHEPIPLINRIFYEPIHELSVCVGPLYGNESKWLEVVEYVEHYKLLGASFFYFSFFNLNEYDRKIVDYYVKMGYAESSSYVTEFRELGWMFHMIQTQECHHRSMYHSRWVINVDIDERLVYTGKSTFLNYLRSMPPEIGELSFLTNRVKKTEQMPKQMNNITSLESDMLFLKYNQTTEMNWYNLKGVIRPELVFVLFYHWSFRQEEKIHVMSVPKRIAHIRQVEKTRKNVTDKFSDIIEM